MNQSELSGHASADGLLEPHVEAHVEPHTEHHVVPHVAPAWVLRVGAAMNFSKPPWGCGLDAFRR